VTRKYTEFCVRHVTASIAFIIRGAIQQDTQRMYNVTYRRVLSTIAAVEKQLLLHIMGLCL